MAVYLVQTDRDYLKFSITAETIIGRGPFFDISDKKVSRNHALLTPFVDEEELELKSIHLNPCFVYLKKSGKSVTLKKDLSIRLKVGDHFTLLENKHSFRIHSISKEVVPMEASLIKDNLNNNVGEDSDSTKSSDVVDESQISEVNKHSDVTLSGQSEDQFVTESTKASSNEENKPLIAQQAKLEVDTLQNNQNSSNGRSKDFEECKKDKNIKKRKSYDSDYEYEDSSEDEKKTLNSYGSSKSRKNSLNKKQYCRSKASAAASSALTKDIKQEEEIGRQKSSRCRKVLVDRFIDESDSCSLASEDESDEVYVREKDVEESEDSDWEPEIKKKKIPPPKPKATKKKKKKFDYDDESEETEEDEMILDDEESEAEFSDDG